MCIFNLLPSPPTKSRCLPCHHHHAWLNLVTSLLLGQPSPCLYFYLFPPPPRWFWHLQLHWHLQVLRTCPPGLFLPPCPVDEATVGLQSDDAITWSDSLLATFSAAKDSLTDETVTPSQPSDQLWIITDARSNSWHQCHPFCLPTVFPSPHHFLQHKAPSSSKLLAPL